MPNDFNPLEIELLIIAISRVYGYDFHYYARTSFTRRLAHVMTKYKLAHLGECQHLVINDKDFFQKLLNDITVTTSDFFRDPPVFNIIKEEVFPFLAKFANFKVWHAGCATGEEVYSLAILLKEANLYSRAIIYATDINRKALEFARNGLFGNARIEQAVKNYAAVNGKYDFLRYLTQNSKDTILEPDLQKNIVFSKHNLGKDQSFGAMQFIMCRNVMIYFDKKLQNKVLELLTDSLVIGGYLCTGIRESLRFSTVSECYEVVNKDLKLYKKTRERADGHV